MTNLLFHFESALGSWDARASCQDSQKAVLLELSPEEQNSADLVCQLGRLYTVVVLLVHSVLFLNFVVAILSQTFAYYEDKQVGLYYEVLVAFFPRMEYDDLYGAVVCAQPPLNVMILPF